MKSLFCLMLCVRKRCMRLLQECCFSTASQSRDSPGSRRLVLFQQQACAMIDCVQKISRSRTPRTAGTSLHCCASRHHVVHAAQTDLAVTHFGRTLYEEYSRSRSRMRPASPQQSRAHAGSSILSLLHLCVRHAFPRSVSTTSSSASDS